MSQIFISYARSTEAIAHLIAEYLRAMGYGVWRDDELPPHRAYADVIEERLRAAKAVVVVWSSEAVRSQWVRAEADVGRELGTLIQLSIDGAIPPLPFNQIHCEDLAGWSGNPNAPGWRKVIDALAGLLEQEPTPLASAPPLPDKPSLAVLPFVALGNDPEQDYFVEGMTDEIVTALTRIRALFVIASSATLSLKNQALDPRTAARRLGVRYILEGSVRRAGAKVRIAVKLTDASNNVQIWAERFEDTLEDVFALQDHVALSVAGVIEPSIRIAEQRRTARSQIENLGCYDLYLHAAHLRATLRKAEVIQALELLNRALALDPEFAPALAQAAGCHSQIYFNSWDDDREAHRREGLLLAERAVRAAGDDASVLTQAANALMDLGEQGDSLSRATGLIERATSLNPGLAHAWFISGVLKLINGACRDAVEDLRRAARLDPISPLHESARAHIGIGLALLGNHEEALHNLLATSFRPPRVQLILLLVYHRLGLFKQAVEELRLYEQRTTIPAETMVSRSMSRDPQTTASLLEAIARARQS
jgi:adenylate cyclase